MVGLQKQQISFIFKKEEKKERGNIQWIIIKHEKERNIDTNPPNICEKIVFLTAIIIIMRKMNILKKIKEVLMIPWVLVSFKTPKATAGSKQAK